MRNKFNKTVLAAVASVALLSGVLLCMGAGVGGLPAVTAVQAANALTGSLATTNPITLVGGYVWTNKIAASTAWGNWTKLVIPDTAKDVFLEFGFSGDAAGTDNQTLVLGRNVSGNGAGTNGASGGSASTNIQTYLSWPVAANGAVQVVACTNLSSVNGYAGAAPYLYFCYITNAGASINITNYYVKVYVK